MFSRYGISCIELPYRLPKKTRRAEKETVYFVRAANGLVKIGKSKNPKDRIEALNTASPVELTLLGYFDCEKGTESKLHSYYSTKRERGEWFALPEDEVLSLCDLFPEGMWLKRIYGERILSSMSKQDAPANS